MRTLSLRVPAIAVVVSLLISCSSSATKGSEMPVGVYRGCSKVQCAILEIRPDHSWTQRILGEHPSELSGTWTAGPGTCVTLESPYAEPDDSESATICLDRHSGSAILVTEEGRGVEFERVE
jgi:hypothetical protein